MRGCRGFVLALAALGLAGLLGCSSPTPPAVIEAAAASTGADTENHLRVGDELQIRLDTTGSRNASGPGVDVQTVTIDENGEISLPLIGRVKAGGSTPSEVAERIEASYVPRFYVRCNATVLASARFFYVGGEVRAPGRYAWSEDTTLLKAINTAASFTDYANRRRIEVIRGKQKLVVDYEEIRRSPAKDLPLRPGDSIWVARSIF